MINENEILADLNNLRKKIIILESQNDSDQWKKVNKKINEIINDITYGKE